MEDTIYTPAEVAARLRCSKTNVYDLIAGRDLAVTRIGAGKAGMRITGSALAAFLQSRTTGGPTAKGKIKYLRRYVA